MNKIISANYRDRTSPYKWLIRDADKPAETAVAAKRIVATNVRFQRSDTIEKIHGCSVVAFAEKAEAFDIEKRRVKTKLAFLFGRFISTDTGATIDRMSELELNPGGEMIATIPA